ACKLGPGDLAQVLRPLTPQSHPDLIVGRDTRDDALVWRRPHGAALVATVDVFTPLVDDAYTWGRIAAVNAASDVYAMGGTPLFALAIVVWPRDLLPLELLTEVLRGGQDVAEEHGWVVAGGHSVDGPEPLYGQAVIGEVDPDHVLTNAGAQIGDALVLTKPLGTGIVATAVKRHEPDDVAPGGVLHGVYTAAVDSMTRTSAVASRLAVEAGAHAMTDVTGFGLLGHLHELAAASGVAADVRAAQVPVLPGVDALIDQGAVPGGTARNLDAVGTALRLRAGRGDLLADPQTSGGLLVALPRAVADDHVSALRATGHDAARIGEIVAGTPGDITVH
ncbi:MAG: selenide, water dikinase SelD, partial [Nitriliruptoraceae bacterium]